MIDKTSFYYWNQRNKFHNLLGIHLNNELHHIFANGSHYVMSSFTTKLFSTCFYYLTIRKLLLLKTVMWKAEKCWNSIKQSVYKKGVPI